MLSVLVIARGILPIWAAARLSSGALAAIRIRRFWVPRVSRGGVLAVSISR